MTNKSKVKPLGKERILETVDIDGLKEFIRTVIYSGKENESYVETRIRLYQNLKSKSSMPLPPDPDSVLQVIKRAHHQTYLWLRCCERMVDRLPFEGNGWLVDEDESVVKPLWYTGSQLPPLASKNEKPAHSPVLAGDVADDESAEVEVKSPKRKRRRRSKRHHDPRGVLKQSLKL